MEAIVARKMLNTLEPYHGAIYFLPEPQREYEALGVTDQRMGYFGSRAAPMGPVGAEVVIATFYNFAPHLIFGRVPQVWDIVSPAALLDARLKGADAMLRRVIGEDVGSDQMTEAAALARRTAESCTAPGRPLYAGHASLDWPDEPHLVLWHALTLIREFRGDGHVATLVERDVGPCESLVLHAATGQVSRATLQATRDWSDDDWSAAVGRLRSRGWVDADGTFTSEGADAREAIETRTDELALPAWEPLGADDCTKLRALVRPWSRAIVSSGELAFR